MQAQTTTGYITPMYVVGIGQTDKEMQRRRVILALSLTMRFVVAGKQIVSDMNYIDIFHLGMYCCVSMVDFII